MIKTIKKNKNILLRKKNKNSVRNKSTRTKSTRNKSISKIHSKIKQKGGYLDDFFRPYINVEDLNIDTILDAAVRQGIRDVRFEPYHFNLFFISEAFLNKLMETIHNNRLLKKIKWSHRLSRELDGKRIGIFDELFSYSPGGTNISFQYLTELDEINCNDKDSVIEFNTDTLVKFFDFQKYGGRSRMFKKIGKINLGRMSVTIAGLYNLCVLELLHNVGEFIIKSYYYHARSDYELTLEFKDMKEKLKEGIKEKHLVAGMALSRYMGEEFGVQIFGNHGPKTLTEITGLTYKIESAITNEEILSCCNNKFTLENIMLIKFLLKFFKRELEEVHEDNQKPTDELYLGWQIFYILLMGEDYIRAQVIEQAHSPIEADYKAQWSPNINLFFWRMFITIKMRMKSSNYDYKRKSEFLDQFSHFTAFKQIKEMINTAEFIKNLQKNFPQFTDRVISKYLRDAKIPLRIEGVTQKETNTNIINNDFNNNDYDNDNDNDHDNDYYYYNNGSRSSHSSIGRRSSHSSTGHRSSHSSTGTERPSSPRQRIRGCGGKRCSVMG